MRGMLTLSWGPRSGGLYIYRDTSRGIATWRLCLWFVAITCFRGIEVEDLMDAYASNGELHEVMKRAQWHREDALSGHARATSIVARQYYQGAAEALNVVILDYDQTVAKTQQPD